MKVPSIPLVLVFLGLFSLSCADDSGSSEELTSQEKENLGLFIQGLVNLAYSEDKLNAIQEVVQEFKDDTETDNVTLVGTQKILDDLGNVKEIRTIELFIPRVQPKPSTSTKKDDIEFDIEDIDKIRELKEKLQSLTVIGISLEAVYLEQDKDENIESGLYLSKDLLAVKSDGVIYGNKSINVDTLDQVQAEYKQLINTRTGSVPPSYLAFDKKGNFIKSESTVVPEAFAVVESDYESPSADIIKTTLHSFVNVFLESENKDEVPENLRHKLESHYSDVKFFVTVDEPTGSYISRHFSLNINYELGLEDTFSYSVYGYNSTL